jgi:thiol-disulfide isomerase/thioredoxin
MLPFRAVNSTRLHPTLAAVLVALAVSCAPGPTIEPGRWRVWLDSPGGELPFEIELDEDGDGARAWIVNGPERIEVPEVEIDGGRLVLSLPHYDSRIELSASTVGKRLDGEWSKRTGPDTWSKLPAHATRGKAPRFTAAETPARGDSGKVDIAGRWTVQFSSDAQPAVGLFEIGDGSSITGTFLTATGDYRYLAGSFEGDRLRLSCFDGAHAFLFDATLAADGSLAGNFWSRDSWHETWTARPDPGATLPDAFGLTRWTGARALDDLVFPDLDGNPRSLADPSFAGKARILQIFGSWCPNCNDAAAYTVELHRRYGDRGLAVVGLAFEITGDFERDSEQVRIHAERYGIEYPILIAGLHDKAEASKAFPVLDRVRAYPTFVFMDGEGEVRAIYTGFAGPATGDAHAELREQFESLLEDLLR